MKTWDDREKKKDKKLENFSVNLSLKFLKIIPRKLQKYEYKFSNFVRKHGIELTLRQYWMSFLSIQFIGWVLVPFFLPDLVFPLRSLILTLAVFLFFTIERNDDDGSDDDEPPKDDGGIPIKDNYVFSNSK